VSDFEALVRRHQAAVCATAFSVLRDRARAEEIAQDAFLIAWRDLPTLDSPPALPAWICGIARNLARNAARKRREAPMTDATPEPETHATPLDRALSAEQLELANSALGALDEADRDVLVMYYAADESIAGVAAALAIPEPTARKRLSRTRARLRETLAAVEATLRQARPGPAFTLACVAALAAGKTPTAAAATATPSPAAAAAKPIVPIAIGAAVLAGIGAATVALATSSTSSSSSGAPEAPTLSAASSNVAPGSAAPAGEPGARTANDFLGRISRTDRAARLARITAAATTPREQTRVYDFAETKLADLTLPDPIPTGPLSKKTLRYAIKLMQPMLLACRPSDAVHGRLDVRLHLAGDAAGTVIESVDIAGDPPLSDDVELVECVRTTLETIELPPKDDAAPWEVYYPFVL
jgi:RNA polymerase sigma factor (sigma-70 family)